MKKKYSVLFVSIIMFAICALNCSHVHSSECNEYMNCQCECYEIAPIGDEYSPL